MDINRGLDDILASITEAKDQSAEGDNEQLRQALSDTQKLIAFMNDIDVRASIAVERIVPITLTYEERLAGFTPLLEQFEMEVKKIEAVAGQLSDEDTASAEILVSIEEMKAYIEKGKAVTPKTIKELEIELNFMNEKAQMLTEVIIKAGGDFEVDLSVETSTTLTGTTTSPVLSL